ncbi:hypothetical protein [Streptomyces sp. CBMA152]|uniref:hypothetical protein n=1 Tax=Streptomyces sp. CBMA152 TaxID=1896312 RepID=UPI0016616ADB|nr:hypothetical protein [Streptomyces sp. CBMA152]MBD0743628.1 hypothetical protein [Streptomyces sp. CBMA152]
MTNSTDATTAGEEAQTHLCTYCSEPGADCCVGIIPSTSGPDKSVYAHGLCARDRGVPVLYRLTTADPASHRVCAVCREPGASVADSLLVGEDGSMVARYVHDGCAAAEVSSLGMES